MHKSAYISILAALAVLTSCNKAVVVPQQYGTISLSVSSDVEVVADTRADDAVDCSGFQVEISGETFIGNPFSEQYLYSEIGPSLSIPYGTYTVSAQNYDKKGSEEANDGLGDVWFRGESDPVSVLTKEPQSVTVGCKMVNGKVTLILDESFLMDFTDIHAQLAVPERTVTMTQEQITSSDAYFSVAEEGDILTFTVYGTIAQRELSYTSTLTLSPAKWAKITIKSNHNGIIGPDIDIDETMGNNGITEIINPDGGSETLGGSTGAPTILVNTQIDDATIVDCVLDVLQ